MNRTIASIDIGTNTILLTIAQVQHDGSFVVCEDIHSIARLGERVDASGRILEESILRANVILQKYHAMCDEHNVSIIKVVGTSCLRDAANREEVCERLSSVIRTPIDVISGDEEARLCYIGSVENEFPTTIVDIGGGSTEIISGRNSIIEFRRSIDIGAVRLTERYLKELPPSKENLDRAKADIRIALSEIPISAFYTIQAVAGTPTTLAAMMLKLTKFDAKIIHNYKLLYEDIQQLSSQISELSLHEILQLPGVHPQRADILLGGILILDEIIRYSGKTVCMVSTKGLRYGVMKELAYQVVAGW